MSRRQALVDAVRARMALILTAGGYQTNLGLRVHEHLGRVLEKSELPAINVKDGERVPVFAEGKRDAHRHNWSLAFTLDLIFDEGDATAADARQGIADVYKAIGVGPTWKDGGGNELAARTVPVRDLVMTDKEGNWLGGARVEFQIEFYTNAWGED